MWQRSVRKALLSTNPTAPCLTFFLILVHNLCSMHTHTPHPHTPTHTCHTHIHTHTPPVKAHCVCSVCTNCTSNVSVHVCVASSISTPALSLSGLNIIFTIVKSVLDYPEVCQGFFQLYFLPIVEEIFAVVSEASHTSSMYATLHTHTHTRTHAHTYTHRERERETQCL